MGDQIEYQIMLPPTLGKVFPGVINDMVCAKRTHEVQLTCVIHPSNFSPVLFGQLHGERTSTTTSAVDQNSLPRLNLSLIANPLEGDHSHLRDGRRFLE